MGGLKITLQKSYNPYGSENQARVEHDEQRAAEDARLAAHISLQQSRDKRRRDLLRAYYGDAGCSTEERDRASTKASEDGSKEKPDERMRLGRESADSMPWYARSAEDAPAISAKLLQKQREAAKLEGVPIADCEEEEDNDVAHTDGEALPSFDQLRSERIERERAELSKRKRDSDAREVKQKESNQRERSKHRRTHRHHSRSSVEDGHRRHKRRHFNGRECESKHQRRRSKH